MGNTLFIVWRESVEAILVVGILLAWMRHNQIGAVGMRALAAGVVAGLGLAGLLGWAMVAAQDQLSGNALEGFQVGMLVVAAALIAQMVLWMRRHGRGMRQSLQAELQRASERAGLWGVAAVAALAVAREGAETAVFLYGVSLEPGSANSVAVGALLGVAAAVATAWAVARGLRFLDYRRFFSISGWLLMFFAVALLVSAVDRMIGNGWLPTLVDPLWSSAWLVEDGSRAGSLLSALVGYRAQPSLTLVLVYGTYWVFMLTALRRTHHHA